MRMALLDKVSEIYNESHKNKISFTPEQKYAFSKLGSFGVPLNQMGEFLDLASQQEGQTQMDKWLQGEDGNPNHITGIPISWNQDESRPTEFQMWMKAMRQTDNSNLADKIKDGTGVAIKAADHPHEQVYIIDRSEGRRRIKKWQKFNKILVEAKEKATRRRCRSAWISRRWST